MDIIPLRGCNINPQELAQLIQELQPYQAPSRKWELVWQGPAYIERQPLDSEIMNSDNHQAIASHISEMTVVFSKKLAKKYKDRLSSPLNISVRVYEPSGRVAICGPITYPINKPNLGRP